MSPKFKAIKDMSQEYPTILLFDSSSDTDLDMSPSDDFSKFNNSSYNELLIDVDEQEYLEYLLNIK